METQELVVTGIQIRKIEEKDIPQLLPHMYEYIVDFYKQPRPSESSLKGLINYILENPHEGIQFVAETTDTKEIVGFAILYFSFNTLAVKRNVHLHDLFVAPSRRGKNIGELLINHCIAHTRENDYSHMFWETAHDNLVGQSLYDKIGGKRNVWVNYEIS
ncbi:GNAT family N-acetyltransferase [Domibacillus aminovorans]|uniref:GCN5 family acetyltransferase n=1 Tax=Domibacillus aminovorans TaxID=29332 RepID=A0A177LA30_9BACI|nr:N-acetyltransferase [Domibacillus aminovorans]OAH62344.1 GCN5 family acetyltransferase [Domibacillus aminovorans]